MQRDDFREWLAFHFRVFPDFQEWFAGLHKEAQRTLSDEWFAILKRFDKLDCVNASRRILSGQAPPIPAWERSLLAAAVCRIASKAATDREKAADLERARRRARERSLRRRKPRKPPDFVDWRELIKQRARQG